MFAPTGGIPEDPATGSAAAGLTAYLATLEGRDIALTISQGVEMGRRSVIETTATLENGIVTATTVAGRARQVAKGRADPVLSPFPCRANFLSNGTDG